MLRTSIDRFCNEISGLMGRTRGKKGGDEEEVDSTRLQRRSSRDDSESLSGIGFQVIPEDQDGKSHKAVIPFFSTHLTFCFNERR
jgi:hypothetical protein